MTHVALDILSGKNRIGADHVAETKKICVLTNCRHVQWKRMKCVYVVIDDVTDKCQFAIEVLLQTLEPGMQVESYYFRPWRIIGAPLW